MGGKVIRSDSSASVTVRSSCSLARFTERRSAAGSAMNPVQLPDQVGRIDRLWTPPRSFSDGLGKVRINGDHVGSIAVTGRIYRGDGESLRLVFDKLDSFLLYSV